MTSWLMRAAIVVVVLYLIWMGWKSWQDSAAKAPKKTESEGGIGGKKDMLEPAPTTSSPSANKPPSATKKPIGPCPKPGQKWSWVYGKAGSNIVGGKGYWDCR